MSAPLGLSSLQDLAYEQAGLTLAMGDLSSSGFEFDRHLDYFSTAGTFTWTRPTPPSDKVISHYIVQLFNGGSGGGRPGSSQLEGGRGGIDGGSIRFRLEAGDVGATETVVVGAGGAGATSAGYGGTGGDSSFGASSLRAIRGKGQIVTGQGPIADESKPGRGGDGAGVGVVDVTSSGSVTISGRTGGDGGPSANAAGGPGGYRKGWWGSGSATATAGSAGGVYGDNSEYASGGGGGGGGGSDPSVAQPGASGGAPGGGGGGGASTIGSSANGSGGARGAVAVWTVMRRVIADA